MKRMLVTVAIGVALGAMNVFGADAQANWDKNCASCHGKDGKGQTAMGKKVGVSDYTDAASQAKFTDEEAIKAIKEGIQKDGKTVMKPYADKLSDDEIKELVAHIRKFKS